MNLFNYLIIFLLPITFSCSDEFDEDTDLSKLGILKAEAVQLIGSAFCSDIGECRSIALGVKPCGGPWEYLIYSTLNTDTTKIIEKVEEYNAWNETLNERYNYTSDCMIVGEPQLLCLNDTCVDRNEVGESP